MVILAFVGLGPIPVVIFSTAYAIYISHISMVFYFAPIFLVYAYGLGFLPALVTGLIFYVWQRSSRSSDRSDFFVAAIAGAGAAFLFGAVLQSVTDIVGNATGLPDHEKVVVWTVAFGLPGLIGGAFTAVCLNWKR